MEELTEASSLQSRTRVFSAISLLGLLGLFGAGSSLLWVSVLPEKYFFDGNYIRGLLATDLSSVKVFDTFINTAWVFSILGFRYETSQEAVAVILFILAFIPTSIWFIKGLRKLYFGLAFLLAVWLGIASIYLGQYSKEVIAVWFVALILYIMGIKRPFAWWAVCIPLIYAIAFRPYWIVITVFWILFWWLSYRRWSMGLKSLIVVVFMLSVSASYYYLMSGYLTDIRTQLNESRVGSDFAQSMLLNYLPNSSIFHDLINWFISWIFIILPLPVLRFLDPLQILFFLVTVSTTMLLFRSYHRLGAYKASLFVGEERRIKGALAFIAAFTLAQAIFEPDYGSVLKHFTDLLPMLSYLLAMGLTGRPLLKE